MANRTILLRVSGPQYDAALAALRLLSAALIAGAVAPDDGDIGDILTDGGAHPGLTADEIADLGDFWQSDCAEIDDEGAAAATLSPAALVEAARNAQALDDEG